MVFTGINANVLASVIEQRTSSLGDEAILSGDYSGFVRKQDTGETEDESSSGIIDARWDSGWIDFNDMYTLKNLRFMILSADSQEDSGVDVKVGFDGESGFALSRTFSLAGGSSSYGTGIYGTSVYGGGDFFSFFDEIPGVCKNFKFSFQNARAGERIPLIRLPN